MFSCIHGRYNLNKVPKYEFPMQFDEIAAQPVIEQLFRSLSLFFRHCLLVIVAIFSVIVAILKSLCCFPATYVLFQTYT